MRNLLLPEYDTLLADKAALWGADDGATIFNHEAHWTAPLGGLSVSIRLDIEERHMVPVVRVASTSGLPSDPLAALAILDDGRATLIRAASAHTAIGHVRVWTSKAPCDWCGAKGGDRGSTCQRCAGKGVRS
jgi:hypothetical protein